MKTQQQKQTKRSLTLILVTGLICFLILEALAIQTATWNTVGGSPEHRMQVALIATYAIGALLDFCLTVWLFLRFNK
jgi:hypothetical protein